MRTLLLIVLVLIGSLLTWGMAIEPYLTDEQRWSVEVSGLPPAWEGRRIAVIADLQVGMWLNNTRHIDSMIEHLVIERPAAVLIAGDFVYHPLGDQGRPTGRENFSAGELAEATATIDEVVALLQPLVQAHIPTYAVLGNHDYGMQSAKAVRLDWLARDLSAALEDAGIPVLRNRAVPLPDPSNDGRARHRGATADDVGSTREPLYLAGLDSHYAERDRPAQALGAVPDGAPRVVFMHHPASFVPIAAEEAPLAVAAHTHGGQISLPWTPDWSWMGLLNRGEVHADGWIDDYGAAGNRLYVNRGVGFSVLPVRVNAVPEITWLELQAPAPEPAAATPGP